MPPVVLDGVGIWFALPAQKYLCTNTYVLRKIQTHTFTFIFPIEFPLPPKPIPFPPSNQICRIFGSLFIWIFFVIIAQESSGYICNTHSVSDSSSLLCSPSFCKISTYKNISYFRFYYES